MSIQATRFCWTLNNYTEDEIGKLRESIGEKVQYLVFGYETAPTTGTPHLQGYVEFHKKLTMKGIHKIPGWERVANIQVCRGSREENETYCKKDGKFEILGVPKAQGARTDLKEICDKIRAGIITADEAKDMDDHFAHLYGRTLQDVEDRTLLKQVRVGMTEAWSFYGKTGTGKSATAHEIGKTFKSVYYWEPDDNGWWEGYTGQECVIINDYRGEMKFSKLLRMVDHHDAKCRRRGRAPMPFVSKMLIITSPRPLYEIYSSHLNNKADDLEQIMRRFKYREFTEPYIFKEK